MAFCLAFLKIILFVEKIESKSKYVQSQIFELYKVVSVIELITLVIDFDTYMDTNNLEALGNRRTYPASIVTVTCCSNQYCHIDYNYLGNMFLN